MTRHRDKCQQEKTVSERKLARYIVCNVRDAGIIGVAIAGSPEKAIELVLANIGYKVGREYQGDGADSIVAYETGNAQKVGFLASLFPNSDVNHVIRCHMDRESRHQHKHPQEKTVSERKLATYVVSNVDAYLFGVAIARSPEKAIKLVLAKVGYRGPEYQEDGTPRFVAHETGNVQIEYDEMNDKMEYEQGLNKADFLASAMLADSLTSHHGARTSIAIAEMKWAVLCAHLFPAFDLVDKFVEMATTDTADDVDADADAGADADADAGADADADADADDFGFDTASVVASNADDADADEYADDVESETD